MKSNQTIIVDNVKESFRLAKTDILEIQRQITDMQKQISDLNDKQAHLVKMIGDNKVAITKNKANISKKPATRTIVKKQVVVKRAKKYYIGHKETKLLHDPASPFAKNIKPKNKVIFKSKVAAINQGYKLASSLKN